MKARDCLPLWYSFCTLHFALCILLASHSITPADIIADMLRRILAGLAILSLVAGAALLIFWWRSYHHTDHFAVGSFATNRTEFTAHGGNVMVSRSQSVGGMIMTQSSFYQFRQIAAGSLVIPALWLAITIRAKLPHPGRPPRK